MADDAECEEDFESRLDDGEESAGEVDDVWNMDWSKVSASRAAQPEFPHDARSDVASPDCTSPQAGSPSQLSAVGDGLDAPTPESRERAFSLRSPKATGVLNSSCGRDADTPQKRPVGGGGGAVPASADRCDVPVVVNDDDL